VRNFSLEADQHDNGDDVACRDVLTVYLQSVVCDAIDIFIPV
jgi:hypothetical protein